MLRLLVLLLFAVPAFGTDPPGIHELSPAPKVEPLPDAPIPVDVGRYRYFSVEGYTGPVTWMSKGVSLGVKEVAKPFTLFGQIQSLPEPGEYDVPAGAVVVWGRSQGTTELTALGVVNGKAKLLFSKSFVTGGQAPQPPPDVDPKPVPTAKQLWFVTVEDMQTRSAATAMIQGDTKYWESLRPKGHDFRQYDWKKGEGVNYAKKAATKNVPLPALWIFDKNAVSPAEPIDIVPLPASTAGVDALILKYTGAK